MTQDFWGPAIDFRNLLQNEPLGFEPQVGLLPRDTPPEYPTDRFAQWARSNDAPTGADALSANSAAQNQATTAEAAPCAECNPNDAYSVAFRIVDTKDDGATCAAGGPCAGVYYTMRMEQSNHVIRAETDENGLTQRFFTSSSSEMVYLYLGHRTDDDGFPTARDTQENRVEEAPLINSAVQPMADKKVVDAVTLRQWKPWKASAKYKVVLNESESPRPNQYPSPEAGNDSIGIGHKITDAEIASGRFDQGEWAQPLSMEKMEKLRDEDIEKNGGHKIKDRVFVPLHYYEVDAILDLMFNGGPGALQSDASSIYDENGTKNPPRTDVQNLSKILNRGRYSLVPHYLKNHYNTSNKKWENGGVQNRRDMDARMFKNEATGYQFIVNHTAKKKKK